jgi:hypothetical protein
MQFSGGHFVGMSENVEIPGIALIELSASSGKLHAELGR